MPSAFDPLIEIPPYIIGTLSDGTPIWSNNEHIRKGYTCEMIDRFLYLIQTGHTVRMLQLRSEIEFRRGQDIQVISAPTSFSLPESENSDSSEMSDYYEYYGH